MIRLKLIKNKMYKLKCGFEFPAVPLENLQEKEVNPTKKKQEIIADKEYSALSKVTVNPIPDEYIVPSGDINITENGSYNVTEKANAIVNIPTKTLGTKTITSNGTYKATDDDLDGYSEVEVTTSGVDINDYFGDTIQGTSGSNFGALGWMNVIKKFKSPLTVTSQYGAYMFYNYPISEIPELLNTSILTLATGMFSNAKLITSAPQIDMSNVTSASEFFEGCESLVSIPQYNTNKCRDFNNFYHNCKKLSSIPLLDTSLARSFNGFVQGCNLLITFPQYNTSNSTSFTYTFYTCSSLITIPALDLSKANTIYYMVRNCFSLENLSGFLNLGQAYLKTQSANYTNYRLDLSSCSKLTHDSLMNVINGLYDIASAGVKPQQLVLGSTNLAKLSDEEKAIATAKGWTLS